MNLMFNQAICQGRWKDWTTWYECLSIEVRLVNLYPTFLAWRLLRSFWLSSRMYQTRYWRRYPCIDEGLVGFLVYSDTVLRPELLLTIFQNLKLDRLPLHDIFSLQLAALCHSLSDTILLREPNLQLLAVPWSWPAAHQPTLGNLRPVFLEPWTQDAK